MTAPHSTDTPDADPATGTAGTAPERPVGRRFHELPTLAVVTVLALGLVGVSLDHWRKGVMVMGCALLLAAGLRLALPRREAGLLAIRGRGFDVVLLCFVGALVIALAWVVPGYYHHH